VNPTLRSQFETTVPLNALADAAQSPLHNGHAFWGGELNVFGSQRPNGKGLDDVKAQIHQEILSLMDWQRMESMAPERLRQELKVLTEELIQTHKLALNETDRRQIIQGIQDEMLGLGPIEPLLSDPTVSDILVNGPYQVYAERRGKIVHTDVQFDNEAHLLRVIDRIVAHRQAGGRNEPHGRCTAA
jgi:hypothetical protein